METKTTFKKGQWITAKWKDGVVDFAKFDRYEGDEDFYDTEFIRISNNGTIAKYDVKWETHLVSSNYSENWKLATKEEIKNLKNF